MTRVSKHEKKSRLKMNETAMRTGNLAAMKTDLTPKLIHLRSKAAEKTFRNPSSSSEIWVFTRDSETANEVFDSEA